MSSQTTPYCIEALAHTGLVILDSRFAYRARPDFWASDINCASDWDLAVIRRFVSERPALHLFEVRLSDDAIPVAAYSAHQLAERINWLTGRAVLGIRQVDAATALGTAQSNQQQKPLQPEDEEIPTWACERRTEMLRARGLEETVFQKPRPGSMRRYARL